MAMHFSHKEDYGGSIPPATTNLEVGLLLARERNIVLADYVKRLWRKLQ